MYQFIGAIFLIAGLASMLYVNASSASVFTVAIGLGLILLGYPPSKPLQKPK